MTFAFSVGQFNVRFAATTADVVVCQALRHQCFWGKPGQDRDAFDPKCRHIMVFFGDTLVATCRLLLLRGGREIELSYAAQRYDLQTLYKTEGRICELGRLCISTSVSNSNVLRLLWASIARFVEDEGVALIFGCSSFAGIDPNRYRSAFALLEDRFLAPISMRPKPLGAGSIPLRSAGDYCPKVANAELPPLLRTYLKMGGWVSDHAVIDHEMNTIHVFTGLEIAKVPAERARALSSVWKVPA